MLNFDISPDKVKGFCCTASDPIYMGAPGQATGDINRKIPGTGNSFQDVAMETVVCIDWFPGTTLVGPLGPFFLYFLICLYASKQDSRNFILRDINFRQGNREII